MSFAIGSMVGPYRIVDQIGQGGMATVFKAYHANLDRYVAFKVLHPAFKEDPTFLERFKREAQIVAKLEHPSIVPVYDYADLDGQPYLVMKFIEGETLKARLKREPLSLEETIRILEVVASALTYAHQRGILHRDIKPSNIMLDKQGTPYIADFGLARIAEAGESTLSQDMMLGTPQYISPEQAQGIRELGPATDIYSLGVVLYEIVVGRVPFSADTPYAIVHDHIYKPLPLPSKLNPEVPIQVERVLLKALAKTPSDRYATATDMVDAFRQAVREAGMTEISTAHYRAPAQPAPSAAVTQPPEVISPPSVPAYTVVPSPTLLPADSLARKRAHQRRANLWRLSGCGALMMTCLIGMFVIVRAVSDPALRPWDTADTAGTQDQATPETPPIEIPANVTLDEAQTLVEEQPDDPLAYFTLALAQLDAGDTDAAAASARVAIDQLDASDALIAAAARRAAEGSHDGFAATLYLEVLSHEEVPPSVRNEAGDFLFGYIQQHPREAALVTKQVLEQRAQTAPVYTMNALALLQSQRSSVDVRVWNDLNTALSLDDSLAEAYLVRGLYYQATNQIKEAQNDWRYAISFPDAPDWVTREANNLLDKTTS